MAYAFSIMPNYEGAISTDVPMMPNYEGAMSTEVFKDPAFNNLINQVPAPPASNASNNAAAKDLMRDHETPIESDIGSVGARRERRKRHTVAAKVPRQRGLPSPIEYGEIDLSGLHEVGDRLRPHEPIPQISQPTLAALEKFIVAWGRDHAVAYCKRDWTHNCAGKRNRRLICCVRSGQRRAIPKSDRMRLGAASQKTGCPYAFYIIAEDAINPENSAWRIQHIKGRKYQQRSLYHNHPPLENINAYAPYRLAGKTAEVEARVIKLFETCVGVREVDIQLRNEFPDVILTKQDLRNIWQRCEERKQSFDL